LIIRLKSISLFALSFHLTYVRLVRFTDIELNVNLIAIQFAISTIKKI